MENPQLSSSSEDKPISIGQPNPLAKSHSSTFGFLCKNVRFLNQPICSLVGDQNKVDYRQQFVAQNVSLASTNTSDKIPTPKYVNILIPKYIHYNSIVYRYSFDSTQRQDFPNLNEIRPKRPMRVPQQPAQGIGMNFIASMS